MYYQTKPTELWRERHLTLLREGERRRLTRRQRWEARAKKSSRIGTEGRTAGFLRRVIALWRETSIPFYRSFAARAPEELTTFKFFRLAPPAPFVPEEWHGKPVVGIGACHTGDVERAREDPL